MTRFEALQYGEDGPMCPLALTIPLHPAHEQRTRLLDAFYSAAEKDDGGDVIGTAAAALSAAAYGNNLTSDRMRLYSHRAAPASAGAILHVAAWFWRCPTCGFVLPAQEVRR